MPKVFSPEDFLRNMDAQTCINIGNGISAAEATMKKMLTEKKICTSSCIGMMAAIIAQINHFQETEQAQQSILVGTQLALELTKVKQALEGGSCSKSSTE